MPAPASAASPLEGNSSPPSGPRGASLEPDPRDPLGPVLRLDARPARRAGLALGLSGALLAHGAAAVTAMSQLAAAGAFSTAAPVAIAARSEAEYDLDLSAPPPKAEPPPLPEAEKPPEPPPWVAPPQAAPPPAAKPPPMAAATAAPAAAAAGEALTAEPEPTAPLDPTDEAFSIVTAPGDRYPGGLSEGQGTATRAVRDPRARGDAPWLAAPRSAAAPPRRPPSRDLSRPAGVLGSTNWSTCPFPVEAERAQISSARVILVVSVDASGRARSATVQSEAPSGFGFANRARQCALARRFEPARAADGEPVAGTTPPLNIRFTQ